MKKPGYFPLRYRFMLTSSIMLILLLSSLAVVLGGLQSRTIRGRIQERGLAIAHNLAAVSRDYLITYNYVALEKLVNQSALTADVLHVIFHDKEGKVAAYSDRPDLQNKQLTDEVSRQAVAALEPKVSIRKPETGRRDVMDVVVPVILQGNNQKWGTVRVSLSLDLMYQQINQTFMSIAGFGALAIVLGILISNWAAGRITRPLNTLMGFTREAAEGKLDGEIAIHTRDEVQVLASNFATMIGEINSQQSQLEDQLAQIRQLQQYSEKVLATMGDGLLALDMEGGVTAANPAARCILDISTDEAVEGLPVWGLVDERDELAGYIRTVLVAPRGHQTREIRLKRRDHEQFILVNAGVLEGQAGAPMEIIFNLNDVTALKDLEAKIRQTQRLADLGTIAAGMAHEIRNPLSAIKTYVALMPKKINKPGFLEKFQRTVPREINRLNNLIEEMLELSRKPQYNFENTDVEALMDHCVSLLDADFRSRGIVIDWEVAQDLGPIQADADQLEKAFLNLMQNGGQAMPDGGRLTVEAVPKNDWAVFRFMDTGVGMSEETAKNIFDPFFTTKAKGTGLGLAITHKVITEHGGKIHLTSEEGVGSSFIVRLPLPLHLAPPGPGEYSAPSFSG